MTARLVTRVKKNDDTNFPPFPNPPPRGFLKFSSPYSFNSKYYWANFRIIPQLNFSRAFWGRFPYFSPPFQVTNRLRCPGLFFLGVRKKLPPVDSKVMCHSTQRCPQLRIRGFLLSLEGNGFFMEKVKACVELYV